MENYKYSATFLLDVSSSNLFNLPKNTKGHNPPEEFGLVSKIAVDDEFDKFGLSEETRLGGKFGQGYEVGKINIPEPSKPTRTSSSASSSEISNLSQSTQENSLVSDIHQFELQVRAQISYKRTQEYLQIVGANDKVLLFLSSNLFLTLPRFLALKPAIAAALIGNILAIKHYLCERNN